MKQLKLSKHNQREPDLLQYLDAEFWYNEAAAWLRNAKAEAAHSSRR